MKDVHQGLYSLTGFVPISRPTSTIELDEHSLAQVTTFSSSQLPITRRQFYQLELARSDAKQVRRFHRRSHHVGTRNESPLSNTAQHILAFLAANATTARQYPRRSCSFIAQRLIASVLPLALINSDLAPWISR